MKPKREEAPVNTPVAAWFTPLNQEIGSGYKSCYQGKRSLGSFHS